MNLLLIDAETVRRLFPISDCIEAMEKAALATTNGTIVVPPRTVMPLLDKSGFLAVMPGSAVDPPVCGVKVISIHPGNPALGRPAVQGFVAIFDSTGMPLALLDGAEITALRTAGASGLATRLLASQEAKTLGLLGYGVQASAHLQAICAVRDIKEVKVWGRSPEKAEAFAEQQASLTSATITAVEDPEVAAACDVVCVVTGASEPVIFGRWVQPGAHINLVGAHNPTSREADTDLVSRSRIYVDSLESALNEAGDLLIPIDEGAISRSHIIGEIGALLLGRVLGRTGPEQITVYKSVGHASQDLVAASVVYSRHINYKGR